MTILELKQRLQTENVDFEILYHEKPIKSRIDALKYFKLEETAPTLIVKTESGMLALIISGDREKIDMEMIREKLGCNEIKLADKTEILQKLGMKTGEVAMVGHGLPCLIDNRIFQYEYIFGGAGNAHYTLKIKPEHLEKVNQVIFRFD